MEPDTIQTRLELVQSRISQAAENAGKRAEDISLVAVTKTRSVEEISQILECGVRDIGENYVQEALEKFGRIGDQANWHFIGHLQRNKVKQALRFANLIHSVDSLELAGEIGKRSLESQKTTDILLEVNLTGESSKTGYPLDQFEDFVEKVGSLSGIRICGLMGIGQLSSDPEDSRPFFRKLKSIYDMLPQEQQVYLSMGMTQDYEIAIEEGSNMVRIGTAIFGARF